LKTVVFGKLKDWHPSVCLPFTVDDCKTGYFDIQQ
jgi:hypothetical protein